MKTILYILTLIAIITTLALGLEQSLEFGYLAFAIVPYLTTLYMLKIANHTTAKYTAYATAIFVVFVGLYFLIDTTYMEDSLEHKFSFLCYTYVAVDNVTCFWVSGLF
ncbi:MAG: Unknown protein [uncultured Sulfurovum sp.]|uniref:Uncharacterized protein n=1 Tax=uncultured Sulfurovum sp. TaxID=269237 RepID=A0A6S6SEM0_9BACT|nr:MAG: Unknown protein [uncultured Sulfurovum sp.]